MYLLKHRKWPSQHLYLKINSGFHARKNPKKQYLKVLSRVKWSFIQQKIHLCLQPFSLDNTLNRPSSAWESFNIRQKLARSVCFRVHSDIGSSHSLRQIDVSRWVGLALWCSDLTHEISIFVKILFNFKKDILAWIKANLKTLLILPKTKNLKWLHHVTLKIYSLQNPHGTVSGV